MVYTHNLVGTQRDFKPHSWRFKYIYTPQYLKRDGCWQFLHPIILWRYPTNKETWFLRLLGEEEL